MTEDLAYASLWIQGVQVIATASVAAVGVLIAIRQIKIASQQAAIAAQQAKTADQKLHFDLYQKRFEIFETAGRLTSAICGKAPYEDFVKAYCEFGRLIPHSFFLLKPEVKSYVVELANKASVYGDHYKHFNELLDRDQNDDEYKSLLAELQMDRERLSDYGKGLVEQFQTVLDFRNLK